MLSIEIGEREAGHCVRIAGRFDAAQAPAAQTRLDTLAGTITLECQQLEYISSAGLGVLLKTQKRLLAAGGKLRLTGMQANIRDIFVYSGFDQIFEIEPAA